MCLDTPVVTGNYSLPVVYEISGLEPCRSYRVVVTAVTGGGKRSKEVAYVANTSFASE